MKPQATRGYTLVELMLVIVLVSVVGGYAAFMSVSFLNTQTLDDAIASLVSSLRRAQAQAQLGVDGSAFGVRVGSSTYTLFVGDSYMSRITAEDEIFSLPTNTTATGTLEYVFAAATGYPSAVGTTTLSRHDRFKSLVVSAYGLVE